MTATTTPLLAVNNLQVHFHLAGTGWFGSGRQTVKAVDGLTIQIDRGQTLGLVGESGCGKSTTGRAILRLAPITGGTVRLNGRDLTTLSTGELRPIRRQMQIVFQDPFASLNPRHTVEQIVTEPLWVHNLRPESERGARVRELLALVGLPGSAMGRFPHEFSGGQRQRIGIARALAAEPDFIVLDEPVSALDVSIQSQILRLLLDLQIQFGLTYLFIAHDLAVVGQMSDQVAVMYLGRIVEIATRDALYLSPQHPYTQALLSAVPYPDPEIEAKRRRVILTGEVPSPVNPPSGCHFHTRCPIAVDRCKVEAPSLRTIAPGHQASCHFAGGPPPEIHVAGQGTSDTRPS
ncbi:MAG: ATP-binding cassette domain-containing protein [Proteobacteria bacterium]|nr:ATP-binding cassette domain-containing protein [Pseudomonadota bacterium]